MQEKIRRGSALYVQVSWSLGERVAWYWGYAYATTRRLATKNNYRGRNT
jgi:hypothetical protein